jgi:GTP pyrophosphokinase
MTIDVEVNDLKHLNTIISHLRARPVVSKVERVNG